MNSPVQHLHEMGTELSTGLSSIHGIEILQNILTTLFVWYRSIRCHIANFIVQVPLHINLQEARLKVWRTEGSTQTLEHSVSFQTFLRGSLDMPLHGDIFGRLIVYYHTTSQRLDIQLIAKKVRITRGQAFRQRSSSYLIELELSSGLAIRSSSFQVKSKLKGFTVRQVLENCPLVRGWRENVENALPQANLPIPVLPLDVLEPLRELARVHRHNNQIEASLQPSVASIHSPSLLPISTSDTTDINGFLGTRVARDDGEVHEKHGAKRIRLASQDAELDPEFEESEETRDAWSLSSFSEVESLLSTNEGFDYPLDFALFDIDVEQLL